MCFSATASFVASAGLSIISLISIRTARTVAFKLFACTPLLFAIQQAAEGFLWLSLNPFLTIVSTYIFLFFALVWWPVWIPSVIYLLEEKTNRKQLLVFSSICGGIFALFSAYNLIVYGARAEIIAHHIAYAIPYTRMLIIVGNFLYLMATVAPCFISSVRSMWLFGLGIIGAYGVAQWWFSYHFASVWCFFAAVLSGFIFYIVWNTARTARIH